MATDRPVGRESNGNLIGGGQSGPSIHAAAARDCPAPDSGRVPVATPNRQPLSIQGVTAGLGHAGGDFRAAYSGRQVSRERHKSSERHSRPGFPVPVVRSAVGTDRMTPRPAWSTSSNRPADHPSADPSARSGHSGMLLDQRRVGIFVHVTDAPGGNGQRESGHRTNRAPGAYHHTEATPSPPGSRGCARRRISTMVFADRRTGTIARPSLVDYTHLVS